MGGEGSRTRRNTVSARPMREPLGQRRFDAVLALRAVRPRRSPSGGAVRSRVVPSVLRSMMKNAPDCGSRRMRACSRETSTEASIRTSAR